MVKHFLSRSGLTRRSIVKTFLSGRHCSCVRAWTMAQCKKVLIVEDNVHWRKLLAMVVERSGYEVLQATTGIEAVERANAALPDLILMDLGLPEMSGGEATAILKRNPATQHIPIVIQTAYACTQTDATVGAAEVLVKPIELTEIHRVLRNYLGNGAATAAPDPVPLSKEIRTSRPV